MSIAITDEHRALADTASDFLLKHGSRAAARALLEAPKEAVPEFWSDLCALGWPGLHIPEQYGGSGYGLSELTVVVEELGRAVAPGPFVPSAIASAVIVAAADDKVKKERLPGLAAGSTSAGISVGGDITVKGGKATGSSVVLGGELADIILLPAGEDVVIVEKGASGVKVTTPQNLDPTRRSSRVSLKSSPVEVLPGGRRALLDMARL